MYKALRYVKTHSPEEIATKVPADFYAGDKDLYLTALKSSLDMFSPDGTMPADAPQTVLNVVDFGMDAAAARADVRVIVVDGHDGLERVMACEPFNLATTT